MLADDFITVIKILLNPPPPTHIPQTPTLETLQLRNVPFTVCVLILHLLIL